MTKVINQGIKFDHKELERCRVFLIYVSRTYRPFIPYLRGLHQTIERWRGNRDSSGWKMTQTEFAIHQNENNGDPPNIVVTGKRPPPGCKVAVVDRLKNDIGALNKLTSCEAPPKVVRRRKKVARAYYGFGDASGKGFGNGIQIEKKIYCEFGQWASVYEGKHSNWKELKTLVNTVENALKHKLLQDCELYLFTDNMVAEMAYYNGGSNMNKELDELIFRLWEMQMHNDFTLYMYHIAGTRMIECGIDGLSRGDKSEGIASGEEVITFVPIHQRPDVRSTNLVDWVKTWWHNEYGLLHTQTAEDYVYEYFILFLCCGISFLWSDVN